MNQQLSSSHLPQPSPPCLPHSGSLPSHLILPLEGAPSSLSHPRSCWSSDWRLYLLDNPMVPGMPGKSTRAQRRMVAQAHTALASSWDAGARVCSQARTPAHSHSHTTDAQCQRTESGALAAPSQETQAFLHGPSLLSSCLNFVKKDIFISFV